jgi:hypothetical protein
LEHRVRIDAIVRRVEIDEAFDSIRICRSEASHLFAGDRVPDEDDASELERIERDANVLDQSRRIIAAGRVIGLAEPAPRERDAVKAVGEPRRELVERMGGVAESGQEDDGGALAAEVQRVQPDVSRDANHGRRVMRRVAPRVDACTRTLCDGAVTGRCNRRKRSDDDPSCTFSDHGTVLLVDISFTNRYKNSSLS